MSDKTKSKMKADHHADHHADFHSDNELIEPENLENTNQTDASELAALQKALEEAQLEAKTNWEKLLRKEAELQNAQRRASEEVERTRKFSTERMAQELLSVIDSFEQGLRYEQDSNVKNGMQLTYSVLLEALNKCGIKEINPNVSDPFDAHSEEAISVQDSTDMPPNCVLMVVQKGYLIHDRVLRAARVIVSRTPNISSE